MMQCVFNGQYSPSLWLCYKLLILGIAGRQHHVFVILASVLVAVLLLLVETKGRAMEV